jgi:hypothetical protein
VAVHFLIFEKGRVMKKYLLLLLFVLSSSSYACSFDTDCEVGSKCLKQRGQIEGVCIGGLFPGNKNDRAPVKDWLDLNGTAGNTCSFDIDCGPGSACIKSRGAIEGVCLRKKQNIYDK